ncbi:DUF4347 domain-containing protein [Nostoc sp. FACHB-152]|uniref:DUF4347 domain-containing protein n=1 Tax=Nostoc sp. FACHB-152 TaxID=2692837 RepID=UPI0016856A42|nr:DUF4347 domain-containing protein [Nostoc sp. FACHB-152]MBD2447114.1 DUF4347 domain-containing protein [Nostoc sp. FACHB-152]
MSTTVLFASFSSFNLESELNLDNLNDYQQLQPGLIECETLVIFDNRVENLEILYAALSPNSLGYTLTPQDDALIAITNLLSQTKAKRLAIAAHGTAGVLQIGKLPINRAEIHSQAELLQQWNVKEIALYSCEVGKDAQFIRELAWLTGAEIFAATGKVGAPTQGGTWELDIQSGVEKINAPFAEKALIDYPGLLAAPTAINLNPISNTLLLQQSTAQRGGETDGQTYRNYFAFAALKSDGSVVTWGDSSYGGDSSKVATQLASGVTNVYATGTAFAALKADGSVATWGFDYDGGDSSKVTTQLASGVTDIFSTSTAFAALKADGSVVTWGSNGGDSSKVTTQLASGVTDIFSTTNAFAALKSDGSVVTWGSNGGDSSSVTTQLASGVTNIFSTANAFAALKADGSVVTWGDSSFGGNSSSVTTKLASGVTNIFSTANAFAALKSDGSVVTWGSSYYGGDSSKVTTQIASGVTNIFSTGSAFAALKSDGSVVTWGFNSDGGDSSKVKPQLASGVINIYATGSAFAALKADGSVVTWGDNSFGGDSSSVTTQIASGVINIYATGSAFAALKADGSVVTWGSSGGDSSNVTSQLTSGVINIFSSFGAFAALKSDGSVVTWGDDSFGGDSSNVTTQLASGIVNISSPFDPIGLIVAENSPTNTVIGTLSSIDPNTGDTFTYSLVSGTGSTDNNLFTINGNQLQFNTSPNFEAKSSYSIRIRTTDQTNSSYEKAFTINISNVNDTLTLQALTPVNLVNTSAKDTFASIIGTLVGTDPDIGTTLVYGISDGIVNVMNNTVTKEGKYGTLTLNTQTGEYTYTPNATAINSLTSDTLDDFTFTVSDGSSSASQALTINITTTKDTPSLEPSISANLTDSSTDITGTLAGTNPDGTVYGISDGIVDVTNNTVTKEGKYGTLTLNTQTGEYTYTPNATAINDLTSDALDDFTFTVSDGSSISPQAFDVNIPALMIQQLYNQSFRRT